MVGYVQSGKTLSFTTVTTLARDNGFPLVILFAGTKDNLHQQTADTACSRPRRRAQGRDVAVDAGLEPEEGAGDDAQAIGKQLQTNAQPCARRRSSGAPW